MLRVRSPSLPPFFLVSSLRASLEGDLLRSRCADGRGLLCSNSLLSGLFRRRKNGEIPGSFLFRCRIQTGNFFLKKGWFECFCLSGCGILHGLQKFFQNGEIRPADPRRTGKQILFPCGPFRRIQFKTFPEKNDFPILFILFAIAGKLFSEQFKFFRGEGECFAHLLPETDAHRLH